MLLTVSSSRTTWLSRAWTVIEWLPFCRWTFVSGTVTFSPLNFCLISSRPQTESRVFCSDSSPCQPSGSEQQGSTNSTFTPTSLTTLFGNTDRLTFLRWCFGLSLSTLRGKGKQTHVWSYYTLLWLEIDGNDSNPDKIRFLTNHLRILGKIQIFGQCRLCVTFEALKNLATMIGSEDVIQLKI